MHFCMEWKSIKFDWNRARAFLATAEEGSLSAAARALDMSQPTLGRQVSALERELGVALFERTQRGLGLTPGGLALLEHARAMGRGANALSLAASGRADVIAGTVCISAGETIASLMLPPILRRLREAEPAIEIELIASNAPSDLRRREADIALRANRPTQPDLIAKKIGDWRSRFYASTRYLDRSGRPRSAAALRRLDFIGFDDTGGYQSYLKGLGFDLGKENFPMRAASHAVQWEMARQDLGVVVALEAIGDNADGMERVLPDMEAIISPMWLVAHRELRTGLRFRRVFDFLYAELVDAALRSS